MRNLHVDTAGLRAAAGSSGGLAVDIASGDTSGSTSSHPSGVGVIAVDAAIAQTRQRQSARISRQAEALTAGGGRYDDADDGGAANITTVLV